MEKLNEMDDTPVCVYCESKRLIPIQDVSWTQIEDEYVICLDCERKQP